MRRVVITGMGIVSPLGDSVAAVLDALGQARSGIRFHEPYREMGLRAQIGGFTRVDVGAHIDKKNLRFMGNAAAYATIAMQQAIDDAGLGEDEVSDPRTGLIIGSGGTSAENVVATADTMRDKGLKRLSPFMVPRTMSSTVSACLATNFKVKGINYSITSACSTSAHCIGAAAQQIAWGMQDVMFAGGGEELSWGMAMLFDGMGAMSSKRNDQPEKASRAYDADRDGFVIAGGGGAVVLESLEHALARGATILGEVVGFGATSDGADMVAPSGEGRGARMQMALDLAGGPVDYINAHGTATPIGDLVELRAIREVFGERIPPISSTKSLSGHSLGAAGVHEAIYCLLMLDHGFIAGSANIEEMDPEAAGMPIVTANREARLRTVMSNSYGFGGTNACLLFRRP